ncbi:helix-turn-helix domain-containing protein [Arenibacterium sp. LLYu02]|uniref:helix-turn-helix domain-containing protein n=1 Tax=Arenibacterium sp. LLYu02 TaxID=3404132 RepID=UPI003B21804D
MTPSQCRAARALVAMSQDSLAKASGVAKRTIASFENEDRQPYERTLSALQSTLEAAGVEFIPQNGGGVGVRMK